MQGSKNLEQLGRSFKTQRYIVPSAILQKQWQVDVWWVIGRCRTSIDHSWEHPKCRRYRSRRASLINLASGLPGTIPCLETSCAAKTIVARGSRFHEQAAGSHLSISSQGQALSAAASSGTNSNSWTLSIVEKVQVSDPYISPSNSQV